MATKQTKTKKAPGPGEKLVAQFPDPKDKAECDALAEMAVKPSVNAAVVVEAYTKAPLGEQSLASLARTLSEGMLAVQTGDMKRAEAMLYGQAHALQAMFMNLARRSVQQDYMKNAEAFMRMALKAQNQCRMTLETLATIKNPPVVFARQANINNGGQQQVNNSPQDAPTEGQGAVKSLLAAATETLGPATQTISSPFELNSNHSSPIGVVR